MKRAFFYAPKCFMATLINKMTTATQPNQVMYFMDWL